MDKPIIGVTTYQAKNASGYPIEALLRAYVDALVQVDCIPLLIPANLPAASSSFLDNTLDGILFTGGGDIATDRFNGVPHPRINEVDLERDALELALFKNALLNKKPFMGICRGFQVVVVGMGGTLYTHIDDQLSGALKHDYYPDYPRNLLSHEVTIDPESRLWGILGALELKVNSLHHQGAKSIPDGLKAVAHAPDGLVEAVEVSGHPFGFAVQWHPEWLMDQLATQNLFRAFRDAAVR